ncbi:hypothetical protein N7470_000462 [Penicillium chermesinum]|nr:hypothetical protein N7470_000462 [Penicillium chermesinum]
MPSYFYHLSLEVLSNSDIAAQTPLAIESACEALLPFQKRNRPSSSSGDANILRKHERREGGLIAHSSSQSSSSQASPGKPSRSRSAINTSSAPSNLLHDLRSSPISIQCIDMVTPEGGAMSRKKRAASGQEDNLVAAGIGTDILGGLRTKGRYIPLDQKVGDSVWGIVHLYRDAAETPYLASNDDDYPTHLKGSAAAVARPPGGEQLAFRPHVAGGASKSAGRDSADLAAYPFPVTASSSALIPDDDCSTLCVLAVPSYLSVSDFLGFVGERTLDDVSHFRMIRTPRANRYMVLMKFRSGRKAMEWQKEWNGKVFNSMEPETCHVVFVKSVEIQVVEPGDQSDYTPAETLPLSPSSSQPGGRHSTSTGQATLSTKPLAPPTPALIELPTCPVCLERMDETTGLLTIICQHVFHCTCLQKWKGSGCPVCRYTQDDLRRPITSDDSDAPPPECSVCNSDLNLWACLICGNIGCGRYDGAHAFDHWKRTSHAFAMDLTTQRVWDYVGDAYVHRIIQSKTDGKLVELPAADHSA